MKKSYTYPTIETVEIQFSAIICGTPQGTGGEEITEKPVDPFNPAPRRKPF